MERVHIKITGNVQGVFFRGHTSHIAQKLSLTGWVRNDADGSVEIVAEGEKESLEKLVAWCREGPSFANVEDVEVSWEEATGEFLRFEVKT